MEIKITEQEILLTSIDNTKNKSYNDSEIASLIEANYQNADFKSKTFQVNDRVFQLQSEV
jgi:hypothetical protein